ncbi:MAG TPA: hypothetical protein PKX92_04675 [Edaphocola sp.]|nr:hypothetical protein [Edaphocola sp.]
MDNNNNFSKKFANTSLLMGLGIVALLLIIFWSSGMFSLINGVFGSIGIIAVFAFIALILGLVYFGQRWLLGSLKPKDIPNGLPATATVIKSYQAGMSMKAGANQFYSIVIEVNVTNPQGETWPAKIEQMLPVTQVGLFQPGVQFAVKYAPNDKSKIVFDQSGQAQNQANQASNINKAMNNPNANYTNQDVINAAQAAPADLIQKVRYHSDLYKELIHTGEASTAKVLGSEVALKDFMPGINVMKVIFEVKDTIIDTFESEIYSISPASSMHKLEPNDIVHILYDKKNPRRVCISGTDKANNTMEI